MVFLPDFLHPVLQRLSAFPSEARILLHSAVGKVPSQVDIPVMVPTDRANILLSLHVTRGALHYAQSCADDINFF